MDPKASAKAKRSHTQHGRKSHPTPAAAAQKKKAAAAQAGSSENVRRANPQTLPSNWDRYGGGEEEDELAGGKAMASGETARKSRGADFAYLIEQARSQQHGSKAPAAAAEPMSFFDELTLGCKLNFYCKSFEVPFLNLDLHALAAQISKLKLSERLFIEEDILPEDLCSDNSIAVSSSLRSETPGVINTTQNLDSLPHSSPAKDVILQTEDQIVNLFPFANLSQTHSDQENVQGTGGDTEKSPGNSSKIFPLKVGDAEAELDLLLESFRETDLSGSIQDRLLHKALASEISFPDSTQTNQNSNATGAGLLNQKQALETELDSLLGPIHGSLVDRSSDFKPQNSNFYEKLSIQDQVFSKTTTATSIEDSIDVLLSETSPILNIQTPSIAPDRQTSASRPLLYSGSSSVGDVRAHASASLVQKPAVSLNELASSKGHLSDLGSGDGIDDFDSWIDTL